MSRRINIEANSHRSLIERIARQGMPADAEVIYDKRNTLFIVRDTDGTEICVKSFHQPRFPNSAIYTNFRLSKARRSYENALRLLDIGFNTPQPYGYAEIKENGLLRQSYYFCKAERGVDTIREWDRFPFVENLLSALAREMVRLHKKGVFMRDFSPGNILFERETLPSGDEKFNFMYVDLNRMEFDVFNRQKQMRNFRAIYIEPRQTLRIAEKYAIASGRDVEETKAEAMRQLDGYFKEKNRNKKIKSLFKGTK